MYKAFFKRLIDLAASIIGFIILIPVILLVIVVSYIIHKGNPFFFQWRPGKNEKVFKIIKFKTMNDLRDTTGVLLPDAARTTKWGAFLRKSSLDEIPQLINIIKGDMSLIGPRPLRVSYLQYYTEKEKLRHNVKPGVTGLAQVSGRNKLSWDEKLAFDVEYVEKMSFLFDLKILFKTIKKVLFPSDINIDLQTNSALDVYRTQTKINQN
ncbi:sugar transferase [Mariniflexile gromovii]|uniref:Sugar transferase n=1 Tax=Mariniflexile gromovii TaxID=362523 RepID=A0ABS4BPN0_9FLAO|nr:sugar transferase [Mariniflexile gromovii]MBP0902482.1 sugar transferase [Mariniflexile gromovii]